jgi:hydroxyacylglutathione hydrolase
MTDLPLQIFTGGIAATNAYLLKGTGGHLCVDAPEGTEEWLTELDVPVTTLVLTHGHYDHLWDAAAIAHAHSCPVMGHRDDERLFADPSIMRAYGLPFDLEPVPIARWLKEGEALEFAPWHFDILHIPGHCPGSLCLVEKKHGFVFGGDVLFAGGVGRYDLPGGDGDLLFKGIREKLLALPGDFTVYPGHGPATTLEREKRTNPFLQ